MKKTNSVVFIHGFNGGKLIGGDNRIHWLNLAQGLNFSNSKLALPIEWNQNTLKQQSDSLQPGGPIDQIFVPVYGPWLKAGSKIFNQFSNFSYDWRRDNNESALSFEKFLESAV